MARKPVQIVKNPPTHPNVASPRPPGPVTEAWLERVAVHHLDRYPASLQMLRRVLARRVEKRARARDEAPEAFAALIEAVVARAAGAGLVDDARFAAARLARLRRRGTSTRVAGAALAAKGVARAVVEAALDAERPEDAAADPDAVERQAAQAYARRRRLGPYRPAGRAGVPGRDQHARDLAAMARAGFAYRVAAAALGAPDDDPPEDDGEAG